MGLGRRFLADNCGGFMVKCTAKSNDLSFQVHSKYPYSVEVTPHTPLTGVTLTSRRRIDHDFRSYLVINVCVKSIPANIYICFNSIMSKETSTQFKAKISLEIIPGFNIIFERNHILVARFCERVSTTEQPSCFRTIQDIIMCLQMMCFISSRPEKCFI